MLSIAICDDNITQTSEIERLINNIGLEQNIRLECEVYFDGNTLVKGVMQSKRYDLIYLKIEMQKINGIQAALQIREIDFSVLIIYISSYEKYLREMINTEPFRFLSKPIDYPLFEKFFLAAYKKISMKKEYFFFMYNKAYQKVALEDIYYFESDHRIATIHMKNGTERFYQKINDIEETLSNSNNRFLRIHQSYLVNYDYIKSMNFSEVQLTNGTLLQISEERQRSIRRQFCLMSEFKVNEDEL